MLHYEHRTSRDIDIFLRDPQLLTRLSPRLNARAAALARDYVEASNFLKLARENGEIDFIVAPSLTDEPFVERDIDGCRIRVETPAEIGVKKAFYRAADLRARDVFDLAVIMVRDRSALLRNAAPLRSKKDVLLARLEIAGKLYRSTGAREIAVLPAGEPHLLSAPDVVLRFVSAL